MLQGERAQQVRGVAASGSGSSPWTTLLLLAGFFLVAVTAWRFGASWLHICVGAAAGAVVAGVGSAVRKVVVWFGGPVMSGVIVFGDGFEVIVQGRRQRIDSGVEDFTGSVRGVRVRRGAREAVRLDGVVTRGGGRGVVVSAVLEEGVTRRVGGIPMRFESARSRMVDAIRR